MRRVFGEAMAGITARPARTALTVLGTLVGVASLIATMGLSASGAASILAQFDRLAGTTVQATARSGPDADPTAPHLDWSADERAQRLNGVRAAAVLTRVDAERPLEVRSGWAFDPSKPSFVQLPTRAASRSIFDVIHARFSSGGGFDAEQFRLGARVAVVGSDGLAKLGGGTAIGSLVLVAGIPYRIIGVMDHVDRHADLLGGLVIPGATAAIDFGVDAPTEVMVETALGAAQSVAGELSTAVLPEAPTALEVSAPRDPQAIRATVAGTANVLLIALGAVALVVGGIGIANVTLVSVMERTGEIGLRRAVGAGRSTILCQFLVESGIIGGIGGVAGAAVGLATVVGVSWSKGWTPYLDLRFPLVAPLVGLTVGIIGGAYPSWRAGRLAPVEALRSGL